MPVILRRRPYRFYIASWNGHEPPHVHVQRDASFATFWLNPVQLEASGNFRRAQLRRLQKIVEDNQTDFLEAWNAYFNDQL